MPYDFFGNPAQMNPYQYPQASYPSRQTQQNVYAFVNGIEGAKSFIVPPNQTVLLMDSERPVCYMKQANSLGQMTLRYFKLLEVGETDLKNVSEPSKDINYVTKEEFEELVKRIEKLEPKGE